MWIGLYWELQTLRHVWDDGEPLTWAHWYTGDPSCTNPTYDTHCNGIERKCVSFTQEFNFRTKDCNGMCNMLCESNRSRIEITTGSNNLTLSSATPTEITTSSNNLTLSSATPTEITTSSNNLTLSSATPTEITTSSNNLTLSSATPTEITTKITTSSNNLTLSSATPTEITTSSNNLTLSSATPTEITTSSNNLTLSSATPTEITTSSNNLTLSSATPTEITTSSNNLTLSSATPTEITTATPTEITTSNINLTLSSATHTEITTSNINLKLSSATPTEELSSTTEITNVITASPALNTLWKVGAWSFHYIHLDNKDVNLTHARKLCKEKNMDIVMIKDEGRWQIIKDIIQYLQLNGINNTGYWIGMVWHENLQKHKWLDNHTVTWTKWSDEEPKCMGGRITLWSAVGVCQGKIQNCVVSNGSFVRTSNCSNLHKVICQQYIPLVAASTDVVETRPKLLNCKCSMQKINQKWHFLDGANISETKVENLVQKDFEDNVKGNISVNKSSLSSVIQKRNSIDDKRPESKAIGWSATLFVAIPNKFAVLHSPLSIVLLTEQVCSIALSTEYSIFIKQNKFAVLHSPLSIVFLLTEQVCSIALSTEYSILLTEQVCSIAFSTEYSIYLQNNETVLHSPLSSIFIKQNKFAVLYTPLSIVFYLQNKFAVLPSPLSIVLTEQVFTSTVFLLTEQVCSIALSTEYSIYLQNKFAVLHSPLSIVFLLTEQVCTEYSIYLQNNVTVFSLSIFNTEQVCSIALPH
ncbi:unnamed protein product [Mytilus edulis]|uniref:C-type lectin domain-containing protein n=1 Tax=Mytilus edulis TaxID=6550 RepID=A0A8S3R256_MYTED|nr:unnamed protein product [Mytilus edulis]